MRDGYRSVGNIVENASVATATHCAKKCIKHADCDVYNIGPASGGRVACEIARSSSNESAMPLQQPGWAMYYGKQII